MKIHPRTKINPKVGQIVKFTFDFPKGFILIIDSREQLPLFTGSLPKGLLVIRDTLPIGDYSVRGFESQITIERKTIPDLLGCLGNDRERFKRELEISVEGTEDELLQFHDFSLMHPEAVRQSIVSIRLRYNTHWYFGSREKIERYILDHLIKFFRIKREG